MGFFNRLTNVAKGAASNLAGDLERANPAAVYEGAVAKALARMEEHKQAAAGLAAQRNRLADHIEAHEREANRVVAALAEALSDGDEDTALTLISRRDELAAALEDKRREQATLTAAVEQTTEGLAQLRQQVKDLKREQQTAVAQLAAAQASIEISEAASGLSTSAQARGLESVRSSINVLNARANEGYLDQDGNPVRAKAAALGRKAAEAGARAELERLKRAHAGETESDDSDASEAPGAGVKRTL